jgi:hypothetical protein
MNLKTAIDDENPATPLCCVAFVGANSFAHNSMFVRTPKGCKNLCEVNSHLQTPQLRFLG